MKTLEEEFNKLKEENSKQRDIILQMQQQMLQQTQK